MLPCFSGFLQLCLLTHFQSFPCNTGISQTGIFILWFWYHDTIFRIRISPSSTFIVVYLELQTYISTFSHGISTYMASRHLNSVNICKGDFFCILPLEFMPPALSRFGYFLNRVSHLCLGQPGLRSSCLCSSWNDSTCQCIYLFIGWNGVLWTFCPGWSSWSLSPI
jgi:hypothetical protein